MAETRPVRCPDCGRRLFDAIADTNGSHAVVEIKCTCSAIITITFDRRIAAVA